MIRLAGMIACLSLTGCADMAPIIDALAKDQNPVCITMTSVWFTATLNRLHGCEQAMIPVVSKTP